MHPKYAFEDLPELDDTEVFAISTRPRIEDNNDMGEKYGAFSISLDVSGFGDDAEW